MQTGDGASTRKRKGKTSTRTSESSLVTEGQHQRSGARKNAAKITTSRSESSTSETISPASVKIAVSPEPKRRAENAGTPASVQDEVKAIATSETISPEAHEVAPEQSRPNASIEITVSPEPKPRAENAGTPASDQDEAKVDEAETNRKQLLEVARSLAARMESAEIRVSLRVEDRGTTSFLNAETVVHSEPPCERPGSRGIMLERKKGVKGVVCILLLVIPLGLLAAGALSDLWPQRLGAWGMRSTRWQMNCTDRESIFGQWDAGKCIEGARRGLWTISIDGKNARTDGSAYCNGTTSSPGALSCENRQRAWRSRHEMLEPRGVALGKLVVFLPGTGAKPRAYSLLLRAAQAAGHHVLGLSYFSNPLSVSQTDAWCKTVSESDVAACNMELHELMLFGAVPDKLDGATSWFRSAQKLKGASEGLWNVTGALSVVSLCVDALSSVKWGSNFLVPNAASDRDRVDWTKVIISGHSQGAGHAAYLSFRLRIQAVLFSGPQDCSDCSYKWLSQMKRQNVPRRALFHRHEECGTFPISPRLHCERGQLLTNLELMGGKQSMIEWNGDMDFELVDNTIVVSTATPTCRASSCELRRSYHESTALDHCANKGMSSLWQSLFTFDRAMIVE